MGQTHQVVVGAPKSATNVISGKFLTLLSLKKKLSSVTCIFTEVISNIMRKEVHSGILIVNA